MHQYSTDSGERLWVPIRIGIAAVVVVYLVQWGLAAAEVSPPWWLAAPGILGTYWGLFGLFDRWLWRMPLVRAVASVRIPDLQGSWSGTVEQTSGEGSSQRQATVDIKQRWSSISIALKTGESTSMSHVAGFETEQAGEAALVYEYLNEPRADAVETMATHRGFARVKLELSGPQVTRLNGDYYTGRGRETFGVINLSRNG